MGNRYFLMGGNSVMFYIFLDSNLGHRNMKSGALTISGGYSKEVARRNGNQRNCLGTVS